MLVMDTALFYPTRLNLSETDAWDRITPLFENASRFGGTVTINWHERSIAPERLWGDFYTRVLGDLTERGAWFCTAAQAVSWFQKRRSVVFEMSDSHQTMRANVTQEEPESLPGLRLRCHKPRTLQQLQATSNGIQEDYTDTSFTGSSISLS